MNKQQVYIKQTFYVGIGHIIDVNAPNYDELWAYFYANIPTKEIKSVLSISRADKYLEDKMLFVTLVEVEDLKQFDDSYYKYILKEGDYISYTLSLENKHMLADIISDAYKDNVNKSEIIELYKSNDFEFESPKLSYLFKLLK